MRQAMLLFLIGVALIVTGLQLRSIDKRIHQLEAKRCAIPICNPDSPHCM